MHVQIRIHHAAPCVHAHAHTADLMVAVAGRLPQLVAELIVAVLVHQVSNPVPAQGRIQNAMRLEHALHILLAISQVDRSAGNSIRILLVRKPYAALGARRLLGVIMQRIASALVRHQKAGLPRFGQESVSQHAIHLHRPTRRADHGIPQMRGNPVRPRPGVRHPNRLGKYPSSAWRKG